MSAIKVIEAETPKNALRRAQDGMVHKEIGSGMAKAMQIRNPGTGSYVLVSTKDPIPHIFGLSYGPGLDGDQQVEMGVRLLDAALMWCASKRAKHVSVGIITHATDENGHEWEMDREAPGNMRSVIYSSKKGKVGSASGEVRYMYVNEAEDPKSALRSIARRFDQLPNGALFKMATDGNDENPLVFIKIGDTKATLGGSHHFNMNPEAAVVPVPKQGPGRPFGEAEDPKEFLRRMSAQAEQNPGVEMSFGFAIMTPQQYEIEELADELGLTLDQPQWDQLNADMAQMERNGMAVLGKLDIRTRDEGHDGEGDLIGSAWTQSNSKGWQIIKEVAAGDDNYIWDVHRLVQLAYPGVEADVWNGISELGKQVLDLRFEFFDPENMFEAEDPKSVFKKAVSGSKPSANEKVNEILEYMPPEFVAAFREGRTAEWHNPNVADCDWWPMHDDDDNTWRSVIYYFDYCTEGGKLLALAMEGDTDGNHDTLEDAEVGTADYDDLVHSFGLSEHKRAMDMYWDWVVRHGEDPLHYLMVPTREIETKFIVGFEKEGDKLKLVALRRLEQDPPGQPMTMPEILASTDEDVKKAREYCLLDANGYTEATEQEVMSEGGKVDNYGRLILRFTLNAKAAIEDARNWIIDRARRALAQE